VVFPTCSYVFNFAISGGTKTYDIKRYQMAIEFVPSLGRKSTIMTVTGAWQFTQPSSAVAVEDFPCSI